LSLLGIIIIIILTVAAYDAVADCYSQSIIMGSLCQLFDIDVLGLLFVWLCRSR